MTRTAKNSQHNSPSAGTAIETLEEIIEKNNVFIDASSLAHEGFRKIETALFEALRKKQRQLIIPVRVIEILEKDRSVTAKYALNRIRFYQDNNLVDIYGSENDGDADSVFMNFFTKNVHMHNLALITQDGDLSYDILSLNRRSSQYNPERNSASVYRISDGHAMLEKPGAWDQYVDVRQLTQDGTLLFIDTSSLARQAYSTFEEELFSSLKSQGQQLIVLDDVARELLTLRKRPKTMVKSGAWEALTNDEKRDLNALARQADYALKSLRQYQLMGLVVIPGEERDGKYRQFADREFLTAFTELRQKHPIALITNDAGLAKDSLDLNKSRTQRGMPVSAYRLDDDTGRLTVHSGKNRKKPANSNDDADAG